jgi:Thiamine biosynthesis protein ThiC
LKRINGGIDVKRISKIGNLTLSSTNPLLLTHVGVTYGISTPKNELEKAVAAVKCGANIIADASLGPNCLKTEKLLCQNLDVPVTALPGYVLATRDGENELNENISTSEILETTEEMLSNGIKGITVHSVFSQKHLFMLENSNRTFPFTSRMGHYIRKYMQKTGKENPFYTCFPEIVALAKKYNAAISIGLALRSPSITNDGGLDNLFKEEIVDAAELVKLCYDNDVSTTLEAGGHITIDKINEWYNYIKKNCYEVPLRILSVVTDRGMGHDNVTGAITAAFLAKMGVEIICTTSRAEHISLPTLEDICESVIHFKIALAAANPEMGKESKVAKARAKGGCHLPEVIQNVIDPEGAYKAFVDRSRKGLGEDMTASDLQECTMCGTSCPLRA